MVPWSVCRYVQSLQQGMVEVMTKPPQDPFEDAEAQRAESMFIPEAQADVLASLWRYLITGRITWSVYGQYLARTPMPGGVWEGKRT